MKKWHVFGFGGLYRVLADSKDEAVEKARKAGLRIVSWVELAEKSCFSDDDKEGEYIA